jgi:lipid-binding SYLF domain-containing protein
MRCARIVRITIAAVAALFALAGASLASAQEKERDRIENAGLVMSEILNIPESIPDNLLAKAPCVVVIPSVLKLAFIIGGSYGRGVMTCRGGDDFKGLWGAPSMMALEGGSFGFQAGGQATDFVLLLMNARSASAVLTSKVKLGVDAAAAAGPIGRTAEASLDVSMRAEILSYSRSRGLFAGVSLGGSTLRPDNRANQNLYGKRLDAKDIVLKGEFSAPPAAQKLLATLNKKTSPHAADAEKEEQQKEIQSMAQDALQHLYEAEANAETAIKNAAGYAVFSDFGVKILLIGSGRGRGIAVNNRTKHETFMKMLELQAGLGMGVEKFRVVFVFDTEKAFDTFVNSGWEFGGQSTAAAKVGDKGGAMSGALSVSDGVWMYQLTDKGLAADISGTGTKYYKDDVFN